ncbi:MAG: DMT family transporter [Parvularculaceae bacterium]
MKTAFGQRPMALIHGVAGIALLCFMDGVIKHLVSSHEALTVTFGRYVFASIFALMIWARAGRPRLTREMWRIHSLRGVIIAISATAFFWSLKVLPLAEAIAISFIAPLLIPLFASALLKERLRTQSLVAGALGFSGVIVASLGAPPQDASGERMLGVAAILCAAVAYALSITLLRGRAGKDGPEAVGVFAALIPGAIIAGPAIAMGTIPEASALPWFVLMGLFGACGMFFLARAYAGAEAQRLAPLEYTALIWAAAIGLLFFGEVPRWQVWAGAAIIIGACLWGTAPDAQTKTPQGS